MGRDTRARLLERSLKAFQSNLRNTGPAMTASYTLIGAIILFGGIGYAIDAHFETGPWFLVAGLLLGIVTGFYQLAKTLWRR